MDEAERDELAAAWIAYQHAPRRGRDRDFWAWKRLDEFVHGAPETAWAVIDRIWRLDSSDKILANLAAGPVEDLLARHGEAFIDRIHLLARQEPVFRKLLGAVWHSDIAEPVWQKLKSIVGPSF